MNHIKLFERFVITMYPFVMKKDLTLYLKHHKHSSDQIGSDNGINHIYLHFSVN